WFRVPTRCAPTRPQNGPFRPGELYGDQSITPLVQSSSSSPEEFRTSVVRKAMTACRLVDSVRAQVVDDTAMTGRLIVHPCCAAVRYRLGTATGNWEKELATTQQTFASNELEAVELNFGKRLIIGGDRRLNESRPEYSTFLPTGAQTLGMFDHHSIHFRCGKAGNRRADWRRHAKKKAGCTRHVAANAPRLQQDLTQEGGCPIYGEECAWSAGTKCAGIAALHTIPPLRALKVKVQQQYRTQTSTVANSCVRPCPKLSRAVHSLHLTAALSVCAVSASKAKHRAFRRRVVSNIRIPDHRTDWSS
ncbi:MAG TPA: hypothetical protein VIE42_09465, partial [Steroidobacteraceae bacterium]